MRKLVIGLLASLVVGAVAARPAGAVINSYRLILSGATYSVAAAPGAIYAGVGNGVKKSVDQGATWTQLTGLAAKTNGLAVDPKSASTVYAATAAGLFRSVDAGASWVLLNPTVRNSVVVSPFDSNLIFADNLRSADGGLTWRLMTYTTTTGLAYNLPNDPSLHIVCSADPANPGFLLASVNEQSFRSVDGGLTWQFFWRDVDSVAIDPVDARYFYLGGRCGRTVTRYFPGGYATPYGPEHVHGLTVDPTNHARVFAVTDDGDSAVSTNYGASWQFGSLPRVPVPGSNAYYMFTPFEGRTIFDAATGTVLTAGNVGLAAKNTRCTDADNDGFSPTVEGCGPVDCDDTNPAIKQGSQENCWDGIDNNCDGRVDMADTYCINICSDHDADGFLATACRGTDCNNFNAAVFPGAPELCDWLDNDCDGLRDEEIPELDLDGDGYSSCHGSDCNDADASVNPGANETAFDGIDQDCNGYDLTLKVTKASYSPEQHGALHVRTTSGYAEEAWLWVDYFGSMHWEPKKGYWEFVMTGIGPNPGTVMVCGYEGCVETPVVK